LRVVTQKKYLPYQTAGVFCDNKEVLLHENSSKTPLPEHEVQVDVLPIMTIT